MRLCCQNILSVALALATGCLLISCDSIQEAEVQVLRYAGPEISPTSSMVQWRVTIDPNDVVVLVEDTTGLGFPHPVSVWRLTMQDTGDPLPTYISLRAQSPNGRVEHLRSGTVYIQDWNLEGVISGEVEGEMNRSVSGLTPRPLIRFWIDLTNE